MKLVEMVSNLFKGKSKPSPVSVTSTAPETYICYGQLATHEMIQQRLEQQINHPRVPEQPKLQFFGPTEEEEDLHYDRL